MIINSSTHILWLNKLTNHNVYSYICIEILQKETCIEVSQSNKFENYRKIIV